LKRPLTGRDRLSLDRLGLTQAIGGLVLGLIALFSSYDNINVAGRSLPIQQQWGIPCIAASVVVVLIVSQLATRARDREAYKRDREHDLAREAKESADREADRAYRRENEADRIRNRAAVDAVGRRPWRENGRLAKLNAWDDALSALIGSAGLESREANLLGVCIRLLDEQIFRLDNLK